MAEFDKIPKILHVLWHFKPIPLRKISSQKISLRQKILLEGSISDEGEDEVLKKSFLKYKRLGG